MSVPAWRTTRGPGVTSDPFYVDRLPPCNAACPAGEDIQGWLYRAESGDYEGAWRALVENNPLPGIMGRVCYHLCESACNRGQLDHAVGIHAVERFLGDEAIRQGWNFTPPANETGKRVLVVGRAPRACRRLITCAVAAIASPFTRPVRWPGA